MNVHDDTAWPLFCCKMKCPVNTRGKHSIDQVVCGFIPCSRITVEKEDIFPTNLGILRIEVFMAMLSICSTVGRFSVFARDMVA